MQKRFDISKLVHCAMLAAISLIFVWLIRFPIFPAAAFLEYDMADVPILIGTFAYGTYAGLMLTVIVSVLQGVLVSSASGWVGIVMHIIATGAFVLVAGKLYERRGQKEGGGKVSDLIYACICGASTWVLVMVPLNLALSSFFYMAMPLGEAFENTLAAFVSFPGPETLWKPLAVAVAACAVGCTAYVVAARYHKAAEESKTAHRVAIGGIAFIIYAMLAALVCNLAFESVELPTSMNAVVKLIWIAILPFNGIKAFGNAALACLVFPPIKKALKL